MMGSPAKRPGESPPVEVGDILAGKYRVERVVGVGGMGVVVAATHVDLEELRALKFMLPKVSSDAEAVTRFFREARAAARLKSEYVARIYDIGRLDSELPFMVMEYLEGEDLRSVLKKRGALPVEEAVEHTMQALAGLAEAHAVGIVHRDLKPANLFVTTGTDGLPRVKIVDFGVSKLIGVAEAKASTEVTQASTLLGSPHYMSPEQLASARFVDSRTDIWSLGVMLFEMLVGRVPFDGPSLTAVTIEVVQKDPGRPSKLREGVPPELDRVVRRCLTKTPDGRFRHVAALAEALAPFGSERVKSLAEHVVRVHKAARSAGRASIAGGREVPRPEAAAPSDPLALVAEEIRATASAPDRSESRPATARERGQVEGEADRGSGSPAPDRGEVTRRPGRPVPRPTDDAGRPAIPPQPGPTELAPAEDASAPSGSRRHEGPAAGAGEPAGEESGAEAGDEVGVPFYGPVYDPAAALALADPLGDEDEAGAAERLASLEEPLASAEEPEPVDEPRRPIIEAPETEEAIAAIRSPVARALDAARAATPRQRLLGVLAAMLVLGVVVALGLALSGGEPERSEDPSSGGESSGGGDDTTDAGLGAGASGPAADHSGAAGAEPTAGDDAGAEQADAGEHEDASPPPARPRRPGRLPDIYNDRYVPDKRPPPNFRGPTTL